MSGAPTPRVPVPPPTSSSPPTSDEHTVKKFEAFYALTKGAYDADIARIDVAESKAARFLTLLTIVIGLTGAGLKHFIEAVRTESTGWSWAFRISYVVLCLLDVTAFVSFFRALRVVKVLVLPLEEKLERLFHDHDYDKVLAAMSHEFMQAADAIRKRVDEKPRFVRIGLGWFSAALAVGAITVACYAVWESGRPDPSGGRVSDNQPEQAPTPADATKPVLVPNENVTAPKFVEQERGVPRPSERDTTGVPTKTR